MIVILVLTIICFLQSNNTDHKCILFIDRDNKKINKKQNKFIYLLGYCTFIKLRLKKKRRKLSN